MVWLRNTKDKTGWKQQSMHIYFQRAKMIYNFLHRVPLLQATHHWLKDVEENLLQIRKYTKKIWFRFWATTFTTYSFQMGINKKKIKINETRKCLFKYTLVHVSYEYIFSSLLKTINCATCETLKVASFLCTK